MKVECAYDKMVALAELIPNPRNPNKHPARQIELLAKIINTTGWRAPITVSKLSGLIVRGHGRYEAARALGYNEAPVDFQEYKTEAEEWADLIADNKIAELATVDGELLADLINELSSKGTDLSLTGMLDDDIEKLLKKSLGSHLDKPEVEFSEDLLLEHNYVVLYFDNPLDWEVAKDKFKLKKVRDLIPRKGQPTGIGRVLNGKEWLNKIEG